MASIDPSYLMQPGQAIPIQQYGQQTSALNQNWSNQQLATTTYVPYVSREEVAEQIDEALKTRVHINVAKDQEDRICELERVVGELVEIAIGKQKPKVKSA